MKNEIQLITYPDSLGGDLKELKGVLDRHLRGKIGGVHILPFYPSSSDRGFSPLTLSKVDPAFGSWQDIEAISPEHDLVADFVVNHVSSSSEMFKDYLDKGNTSRYKDYFITTEKFSHRVDERKFKGLRRILLAFAGAAMNRLRKVDRVFHEMGVNKFVLKKIYRPRMGSPFEKFKFGDGKTRSVWCTFSRDQIDLDLENKNVLRMHGRWMKKLAAKGVRMLRLDAVGYGIKKRGTTSFMIPQTYELVGELSDMAHRLGMEVLPEVHNNYSIQLKLANQQEVDYVYDFSLPPLILHSLYSKNANRLEHWIQIRPQNQITMLDTHDGIGIVDVEGLLSKKESLELAEHIFANGGNASLRASGKNSNNVDLYQINVTFFSALKENKNDYLIARAIQFFVPGIPQVYYVGWLAGENDNEKLTRTGIGRDINRHDYSLEEIEEQTSRPVVIQLEKLMEFRNNYPAFNGKFKMHESPPERIKLSWRKGKYFCILQVDLAKKDARIVYWDKSKKQKRDWEFILEK